MTWRPALLACGVAAAAWACGGDGGGAGPADAADAVDTPDAAGDADAPGDAPDASADTGPADTGAADTSEPPSVGCGPTVSPAGGAWWRDAVVYEVFVRSFRDADGDGVGDLAGLLEKLDHLNDGDPATDTDLGVTALWLMPVTDAASYHGYDTVDYRAVDPDYGTLGDLDALLDAAHARGMRVILDLVMNHSSDQHPWFTDPARRDWYVWADEDPGWSKPTNLPGSAWYARDGAFYYGAFSPGMPDLDYTTPAVRDEMTDVARFWLDRGVDGFRLDAVRFIVETGPGAGQADTPPTHAWWRELRAALDASHPEALLLGEAWTSRPGVAPYFGGAGDGAGDELHAAFDFDLQRAIVEALQDGDAARLRLATCGVADGYPAWAQNAIFLSNHDQKRIANEVLRDAAKLRLAAALLLTLPGTPVLYYGEEIGIPNGNTVKDEDKRLPMRWDDTPLAGFTDGPAAWRPPVQGPDAPSVAAQTEDPGSLLSLYRQLVRLRLATPALATGRAEILPAAAVPDPAVLAFLRAGGGRTLLVLHNLGAEPVEGLAVDLAGLVLPPAAPSAVTPVWGEATGAAAGSVVTVGGLPGHGSAVLELAP